MMLAITGTIQSLLLLVQQTDFFIIILRCRFAFSSPVLICFLCFFLGPNYNDRRRLPYAHGPYDGPLPNRSWAFPLRAMNHSEIMPRRPPLGGPIPVASRGLLPFHLHIFYVERFVSCLVNNIRCF